MSRRPLRRAMAACIGIMLPVIAAHAQAEHAAGVREERLFVPSGRIVLAATLLLPPGAGPHPGAILISGSRDGVYGASDPLPQRLAAEGVAVLVLGKRGVGESTGDWRRESFAQRAKDVRRALDVLERRADIDGSRLGVIGHSQGGWIAQIVAAEDPRTSFAVLLAAPGQPVREQILTDERIHLERRGTSPADVARQLNRLERQLAILATVAPVCRAARAHHLCHIIRFDPQPYLERIRVPVLAVYGELDPMVPPAPNVALVTEALARAGNPDVTLRVFPRANHVFFPAVTGLRDEYARIEQRYVEGFLDCVSGWVGRRVIPSVSSWRNATRASADSTVSRSVPVPRSFSEERGARQLRGRVMQPLLGVPAWRGLDRVESPRVQPAALPLPAVHRPVPCIAGAPG